MKKYKETIMKIVFIAAAATCVLAVAMICIFLFANGLRDALDPWVTD